MPDRAAFAISGGLQRPGSGGRAGHLGEVRTKADQPMPSPGERSLPKARGAMTAVRERRDEFLRTIAQLTAEREAARKTVASVRASSAEVWDWEIPADWRTAGFVQELTSIAYDIVESNPRESLGFAQLALAIATSIPTAAYPMPIQAQIEGAAWKEIGTAHRYMGEFDAALRAYDAAQRALGSANALRQDAAVIELARAVVLGELERYDEALRLLASIEPVLR